METSEIGIWMMIAFWLSAIGGIALGIHWAKRKGGSLLSDEQLRHSLQQRLQRGEIEQAYYDQEVAKIKAR